MHQIRQDLMSRRFASFNFLSDAVSKTEGSAAGFLTLDTYWTFKSIPEKNTYVVKKIFLTLRSSCTEVNWKHLCGGQRRELRIPFRSGIASRTLKPILTKHQRHRRPTPEGQFQNLRRGSGICYTEPKRKVPAGVEVVSRVPSRTRVRLFHAEKISNSKFESRAVTDDQETLSGEEDEEEEEEEEEEEFFSNDVEILSPNGDVGKEKYNTGIRKQGQNLGSYAATRAIAFQESLPPEGIVVLTSCAVGLMTGACVVLFNLSVDAIHNVAWDGIPKTGATWLRSQPFETSWQQVVFVPASGGLVVGILNSLGKSLEGQPQQREQNSLWRNASAFMRPLVKTCAAAVTLGTANSLGPEGPSVEIGASIANGVTTVLRSSRERKLSMVAAGSAAGIASGFNAAVAGCFFAVESVLSGLTDSAPSLTTAMVLLSSVLAAVVSQAGLGSDPAFRIPAYDFRSPTELPLYLLLGAFCGGVSIALRKGTAYASTTFERLQTATGLPSALLPLLGGLCVGTIALAYPEVLYWGFKNVDALLELHPPWAQVPSASLLIQIMGAKIVATSICRGSGLVGGVYAPSLFIGAALGSAYGTLVKDASLNTDPIWHLDVLQVAAPQAYALVAMAATLAGVCQVPLTSVLLLFEITRDYRIILPLMAAVGVSSWVASAFQKTAAGRAVVQIKTPATSSDTLSITQFSRESGSQKLDGILLTNSRPTSSNDTAPPGAVKKDDQGFPVQDALCNLENSLCLANVEVSEEQLTDEILVTTAMKTSYTAVTEDTSLREALSSMLSQKEWCVLIVNKVMHLEGLLTFSDIQKEAEKARRNGLGPELEDLPISTLFRSMCASGEIQMITAYPDMTLKEAQRLMARRGLRQVPVVDRSANTQSKLLVGLLDRECIKLACRAEATSRILRCGEPINGQAFLSNR